MKLLKLSSSTSDARTPSPRRLVLLKLLPVLLISLSGCAEVAAPPGGEVDKIGPYLVASDPVNEATEVPPGRSVVLQFSEPLQRPSAGRAVFISPRPLKEPKVKWKGDRIVIELADSFRENQTYVIAVSSAVTDQHRNRLDSNVTIAFSTGAVIDTGIVAGRVLQKGQPVTGALIGLYRLDMLSDSIPYDSLDPQYLTTTTANGSFSFRYLPSGEFRLIGFQDRNKNERFNPYHEPAGVPDRPVHVGGDLSLDDLQLRLVTIDTVRPSVLNVSEDSDGLVHIRLSRAISLEQLSVNPGFIQLKPEEDSTGALKATSILEADEKQSASLTVVFPNLTSGTYRLAIQLDSLSEPLPYEGVELRPVEDKHRPSIVKVEPDSKPDFADNIRIYLTFSEPMAAEHITDQTFLLTDADEQVVPLRRIWAQPNRVRLIPDTLIPGQEYRLNVVEFDLTDRAGNTLGDSLRQYGFSTLDIDSLGSISGESTIAVAGREKSPIQLSFLNIRTRQEFHLESVGGMPFSASVPAGKYLLSGFIDRDEDGELFDGSILPFRMAETQAFHPDTISVRARFETAGILFEFR